MSLLLAILLAAPVTVGSKKFTESVVLGEIAAGLARANGYEAVHRRDLGGTQVVWGAILAGELDVYAEYTGTLEQETLAREVSAGSTVAAELERLGVGASKPLGFNNTYALAVTKATAARMRLRAISDLRAHPEARLRFGNEFMDRKDGWPALRVAYDLPHADVRGLDHDLAYRGLEAGDLDVMDAYSTDAEIAHYDLVVLDDDRGHFPKYEAIYVWRSDLEARAPKLVEALRGLAGRIPEAKMAAMNKRAKLDRVPEAQVAADFLAETVGAEVEVHTRGFLERLWERTAEHLVLVAVSLGAAIVVAIPLGILAWRSRALGSGILGAVGVVQTIPSLALLVFMIPLLGIGAAPAMVALFLYSLLPIVRNTYAGLAGIAPGLRESAEALGLPAGARLRLIELPLAAPSILAGIKTSAVINVGTATLGALIGAGGYGQPILTGIRLDDVGLILEGAVPAALLALLAQGLFDLLERLVVPVGLRSR